MLRTKSLILAAAVVLAGCGFSETAEQTVQKSWSTASLRKLSLRSVNSNIEIVGRPGGTIRMVANIRVSGPEAKRLMKNGPLDMSIEDGVLTISETSLHGGGRLAIPFIVKRGSSEIEYHIEVPPSIALSITNVSGEIEIAGMQGDTDLQSVNGSINVVSASSPVTARTVNGPIEARFTDHFNGAKLRTVNGPVEIQVPEHSAFVANVSQVNGGFESNIPVVLSRGGRHTIGDVSAGRDTELEVTTVNGDITLTRSGPKALRPVEKPSDVPAVPPAPPAPPPAEL
jgi:hypothetical protein